MHHAPLPLDWSRPEVFLGAEVELDLELGLELGFELELELLLITLTYHDVP